MAAFTQINSPEETVSVCNNDELSFVTDRNPSTPVELSSKSFFRLDPNYGQKKCNYTSSEKVLPPSQNCNDNEDTNNVSNTSSFQENNKCKNCGRILKSAAGLKIHTRACQNKSSQSLSNQDVLPTENAPETSQDELSKAIMKLTRIWYFGRKISFAFPQTKLVNSLLMS